MSDETRLYIAVDAGSRQLVVSGPMALWRELLESFGSTASVPQTRPDVISKAERQAAESRPAR